MTLVLGGLSFPLVASGGRIACPFADKALPFLKDTLNAYAGAAFTAVMAGKVQGQPATLACQETGLTDPNFLLTKTTFRMPYLALYAEEGTVREATARWDEIETRYVLAYVLPPLPVETIQAAAVPFLQAIQKLVVLLIKAGCDASHRSGALVFEEAGIVSVRMGRWQIGAESLGDDIRTAQHFPMLRAELFVAEQEGFDAAGGNDLEGVDAGLDVASADGVYPDAVQITYSPE